MSFRDDRGAMRAHIDQLEEDLATAKSDPAVQHAEPALPAPREASRGIAIAGVVGFAALVVGGLEMAGPVGSVVLVLLGVVALALAGVILLLSRLLIVVEPNQVAILSGRQYVGDDGAMRGYRTVRGGRVLRVPILETADYMDLSNHVISISVSNCFLRGGQRVRAEAVANVKVAGEMPRLANAVERFLGQDRQAIATVAEQTIEGTLRSVLAGFTPEEAQGSPLQIAERLVSECKADMDKLGLVLDTFKLKSVTPT